MRGVYGSVMVACGSVRDVDRGSVMVVCGSVMVDRGSVMVVCGSVMEDRGCYGGGCLWVGDVVYRSVMVVFGFRFAEYRQRIRGGAT